MHINSYRIRNMHTLERKFCHCDEILVSGRKVCCPITFDAARNEYFVTVAKVPLRWKTIRNVQLSLFILKWTFGISRDIYSQIFTMSCLKYDIVIYPTLFKTFRWRHNDHASVSNHQPRHCLLNRLFRRRSKKTSKLRVTGLCVGNSPGPVNSPHKGPVTRKMFPFDDVIMIYWLWPSEFRKTAW